ncbi:MAG: prolyl oligopeptidase family serine peptidase, partial [Bacteroidota bacterium]
IIEDAAPSSIGGIQWLSDNSGFLYSHLPIIDTNDKDFWLNTASVYYKLGSDPKTLKEVFSKANNPKLNLKPEDFPLTYVYSDKDDYVFGKVSGSSPFKAMYYKHKTDVLSNASTWKLLYEQEDKVEKIMMDNDTIIFLSAKNASNYQVCKTSIINPDFENPEVIIAEKEDRIISDFEITKDGLFFVTVRNGVEAKLYHYHNGAEKEITMPKPSGKILINSKGAHYKHLWVAGSGWINASTTYTYDVNQNEFDRVSLNPVTEYDEFNDLVVEEIEIPSHDGAMVPLSIIYKKGLKKNGKNPTLFYGYGSYGTSIAPFFSPIFLTWVKEGGIFATAHVRGGGEKGDAWRKAGYKTTKHNTWKDLIACTEYMIDQDYTSSKKTVVWGTSAGGIMAGRAMTDRPDLYKAMILYSPAMNMLRSEVQPNGRNSIKEFGTFEKPDEFKALLEMDSYHNIKEGTKYPATLIVAGAKDSRVVVWDPAKFAARLQAANTSKNPILFAVDFDSGHGAIGNSKLKRYEQYADAFSFAFWQTGHSDYQPE